MTRLKNTSIQDVFKLLSHGSFCMQHRNTSFQCVLLRLSQHGFSPRSLKDIRGSCPRSLKAVTGFYFSMAGANLWLSRRLPALSPDFPLPCLPCLPRLSPFLVSFPAALGCLVSQACLCYLFPFGLLLATGVALPPKHVCFLIPWLLCLNTVVRICRFVPPSAPNVQNIHRCFLSSLLLRKHGHRSFFIRYFFAVCVEQCCLGPMPA